MSAAPQPQKQPTSTEKIVRILEDSLPSPAELANRVHCDEGHARRVVREWKAEKSARVEPVVLFPIPDLSFDDKMRVRDALNEEYVERYREAYLDGVELPPVVVFALADGRNMLAEGYHRVDARLRGDFGDVPAIVRKGTYLDALRHALASNAKHGCPMSTGSWKNAVLWTRESFPELSNRAVARLIGCGEHTVRRHLTALEEEVRQATGGGSAGAPAGTTGAGNAASGPVGSDSEEWREEGGEESPASAEAPKVDPVQQWLRGLPLYAKLTGDARRTFERDALFYNAICDFKKMIEEYARNHPSPKGAGAGVGGYRLKTLQWLKLEGPERWLLCADCEGSGAKKNGVKCDTCSGDGSVVPQTRKKGGK